MSNTSLRPLWGDGHTHSNWSDGFDTLAQNTEHFRAYDQDFHVAADHVLVDVSRPEFASEISADRNRIFRLGWDDVAAYRAEVRAAATEDHPVVDGLELTWMHSAEGSFGASDRAHVLVRDHIERLPEPAFFRGRSLRDILLELKEREMKPFLAHLEDHLPYDDFDGSEIDGVEVHWDLERAHHFSHIRGFGHWDRWLTAGKRVSLSGGSDCHQMDLWAASGPRNVLVSAELETESIRRALLDGRGYVATTWHPDLYAANGYPGNRQDAFTRFTSWYWMIQPGPQHDRDAAKPLLDRMIAATLDNDAGRSAKCCHPRLDWRIDGRTFGETAEARDNAVMQLSIRMNVPVRSVRLIADGETVWHHDPHVSAGELDLDLPISLLNRRYVRLEAFGSAGDGRDERLMSNPIYLVA